MHVEHSRRTGTGQTGQGTIQKLALVVGFLAFAVAILAAYRSPATGYEQSIYRATPTAYWVSIAVASVLGIGVAITGTHRRRDAAHLLVTLAVLSVIAIPAIRGYYFYGAGDSMTHLGWAKDMQAGTWGPLQSLYPGIHTGGLIFENLTGVTLRRALLVLPLIVFPLAFVTFVSLDVSFVSDRPWAATIGLLSGLLFVPINGLTVHPMAHPSSQTIMLVPFAIFLMFRHLTAPRDSLSVFSPSSVAFGIAGLAVVFYHPQETMDLVAMLIAIAFVQYAYRRWYPDHPIASHRSIRAHTIVLGIVFLAWTFRHPRARARTEYVVEQMLGEGPQTVQQAGTWSSSLQAIGGSVEILFLKLFAVTVVFGLLAGLLGLRTLFTDTATKRDALVTYLVAGLVPPTLLMGFVFVADQGDHYFRFLGFLAVPITILGAVAIAEGVDSVGVRTSGRTVALVLCGLFAVMLLAQAAAFHNSPYMYKTNQQVTEGSMEGYETTFQFREADVRVMGIRGGPKRYVDAIYGTQVADTSPALSSATDGVPGPIFNENVTTAYDEDVYLAMDEGDYQREVRLYEGLRYTEAGFERLETDPRIDRVIANGDVEIYHIESESS